MRLNCVVILGTRPEIIKLSPVVQVLEERGHRVTLIHTEQHYDENMSKVFFDDLDLRLPDYYLGKSTGTQGKQTAKMLMGIEVILMTEKFDCVIVQGDTNTALAGALAAVKIPIPVIHIEAGLRSYDRRMPEEHNRIMIDHIADINFAPTEKAADILEEEQIGFDAFVVGNTIIDAIQKVIHKVEKPIWLKSLGIDKYVLLTYHRAENLVDVNHLIQTLRELGKLEIDILFIIHPRTRKILEETSDEQFPYIHLFHPKGYLEFISLLKYCEYVITDSGGIQEEVTAPEIQKKVYVLRQSTERPEALEEGYARLLYSTPDTYVDIILEDQEEPDDFGEPPYGDGTAAIQIVDILEEKLLM